MAAEKREKRLPELTNAGLEETVGVTSYNEYNEAVDGSVAFERPLTIYLDKREVVTLMTLGNHPEWLVLGWLRNQRMIEDIEAIKAIQVDWDTESAAVTTYAGVEGLEDKLSHKTVTTGCGQGTVFGNLLDSLEALSPRRHPLKQSAIYGLLQTLSRHNEIYRTAGAVHGCALCSEDRGIELFIEDVGRHNAVDTISGYMWLNDLGGEDRIFYTTGRLTSEMVIKVALMKIPVLLSRSGMTHMGLDIARKVGVTLVSRAKGRHFLVYHGREFIEFDAVPSRPLRTNR